MFFMTRTPPGSMSALLLLFFLCSACACPARAASPQAVTIYADDSYPPYSFIENGRLTGIYTEIVRRALERLPEYQVQLLAVPWRRGLAMLESGQAFALYPPYFRPQERPYIRYSEPILTEQVVVYCNAATLAKRTLKHWPVDYHGLRIGMNSGFLLGGPEFDSAAQAGLLTVDQAQGSRANLLKLLRARIDCYLNDRLSILWELERMKTDGLIDERYQPVSEIAVLSTEQGHLGYSDLAERYPFRLDFIEKFNAAIRAMRRDGEIKDITARFLRR
jgi:polar amino acid transport system substrate-binding protein